MTDTYDALHRLKTAVSTGSTQYSQWRLSWTYDRYGNRTNQTQTHGSPPYGSFAVDAATNRMPKLGRSTIRTATCSTMGSTVSVRCGESRYRCCRCDLLV